MSCILSTNLDRSSLDSQIFTSSFSIAAAILPPIPTSSVNLARVQDSKSLKFLK